MLAVVASLVIYMITHVPAHVQVKQLIEELAAAAVSSGAIAQLDDGYVERLLAYARSVAHFPTAVKEVRYSPYWSITKPRALCFAVVKP